jgi:hypothetical protein
MSAAFVQSKHTAQDASGSSVAVTLTNNVAAGNLLIVFVWWNDATTAINSVTGNGNTFTQIGTTHVFNVTSSAMFYAKNVAGGATTLTANFSASTPNSQIFAHEASGCDTSAPLDQSSDDEQVGPGSGANAVTTSAKTTVANGEYIIGAFYDSNGQGGTLTAGTSPNAFTLRETESSFGAMTEDFIQTTAGSIAATFGDTNGGAADTIAWLATFKAAAAGAEPDEIESGRRLVSVP